MKQYGKNRAPAFPLYWCNQKAQCCEATTCGHECRITRNKRYARKNAKGKPMIAYRRQLVNRITVEELADQLERVAKTMGVAFKTVRNGLTQVTGAMRATCQQLFSGDYFNQ